MVQKADRSRGWKAEWSEQTQRTLCPPSNLTQFHHNQRIMWGFPYNQQDLHDILDSGPAVCCETPS